MTNNKPINIYWSPFYDIKGVDVLDWSFLYSKPKTIFSEIYKNRIPNKSSFFACPAMNSKIKKTLVFKNSIPSSYTHTINGDIYPKEGEPFLVASRGRDPSISNGYVYKFDNSVIFFSEEEDVRATISSPYFSKCQYTQYGTICPGSFDIGQWFRPINIEIQMWEKEGEFHLLENEPFFYIEIETDRPVNLHRFNLSKNLNSYADSIVITDKFFGREGSLLSRYKRFKNVGFREKILTEIKKNLINEEPYEF